MAGDVTFLHLTDPHVSSEGVPYERDDRKAGVPDVGPDTREDVLALLFRRLAERLRVEDRRLDGVIFSGDAQNRGMPGGHEFVLGLIREHLAPHGITAERIVATPGNHDVPRDSPPSSASRYEAFDRVWRGAGCVVPWLDGVDPWPPTGPREQHRLVGDDASWAIFPVNTSNWSNVAAVLPSPLREVWDAIPTTMSPDDDKRAGELRAQLLALARYDMARVSERQLEVLRGLVAEAPQPVIGRQLRIGVLHHHLRSPSLREELKPFADISNLEQVRAFIRGSGIDVVLHGHKHERATYFDHVYSDDEDDMHRVLVISGSTFEVGREVDAMRLVTVRGLPHVPEVHVEALPLPRAGAEWRKVPVISRRLWTARAGNSETVVPMAGGPVIVQGSDLDEVYVRARTAAAAEGRRGILVVHLDLPDAVPRALTLPRSYPFPSELGEGERQGWLDGLVRWWQLDRSNLEHRIPYLHGARLRRYGGKVDQIRRVTNLLRAGASTRAVAVLVDPFRDFTADGADEQFASLCLIEFRRQDKDGATTLDAIAFYRAQEIERWWPINVAELRFLQIEISQDLGCRPGRITTIAADARTISRSPTQVAMPIIDRWLDQAPERMHLLADALVQRASRTERHLVAVREWHRSLAEARAATDTFNPDGLPVAIEGLRMLAEFVQVAAPTGDEPLETLCRSLRHRASVNETFERSRRTRSQFDRWAPDARDHVGTLERLTKDLLPAEVEGQGTPNPPGDAGGLG